MIECCNDCSFNFHLSKGAITKFSILYDISLVRNWKRKLKLITLGSERVKQKRKQLTVYCNIKVTICILYKNKVRMLIIIPFSSKMCLITGRSPNMRNDKKKWLKQVLTSAIAWKRDKQEWWAKWSDTCGLSYAFWQYYGICKIPSTGAGPTEINSKLLL